MHLFHFREDFEVLTETGNFDHWEYSVKYTEHLSQTPSVKNTIYGHFIVKPVDKHYLIKSKHTTCFIGDYFGCGKQAKSILIVFKKVLLSFYS